jgi:hypothetical protein
MSNTENFNRERAVIFLHIPKTAGTTISDIIERSYLPKNLYSRYEISPDRYVIEFEQIPEAKRKEFKIIQGHLYFGIHKLLPQPSTYFTILRDPVERVISDYYYIRRHKKHPFHQTLISEQMSLEDLIIRGEYHPDNCQTRYLSGVGKSISHGQCTQEALELAKKNLSEYFSVVGILEEFDKTLLILQKRFGWKNIFYTIQNQTKQRLLKDRISEETLSLIHKYNQMDLQLYDYAKERFHQLVLVQGILFDEELQKFKLMNSSTYGKFSALSSLAISKIRKKILQV